MSAHFPPHIYYYHSTSRIHLRSQRPSQTFSQEQDQEFPCSAIPPESFFLFLQVWRGVRWWKWKHNHHFLQRTILHFQNWIFLHTSLWDLFHGTPGTDGKIKVMKVKAEPDIALELWHFTNSQSVLGNYHLAFSLRIEGVLFLQSKLDTFNTIKCLS